MKEHIEYMSNSCQTFLHYLWKNIYILFNFQGQFELFQAGIETKILLLNNHTENDLLR